MNINLIGVINKLSYGIVCRNILKHLAKVGHKVALFPVDPNAEFEPDELTLLQQAIANRDFFDYSANCIRIWHQHDMAQFVGQGCHVGFPIFELNKFKPIELHHLQSCHKLFVCSDWAKRVCIENNLDEYADIFVVPLGVDTEVFKPEAERPDVFTIHNIGKIEHRKGHDLIPVILNKAFRSDDNFKLKMMWRNPVVEHRMGEDKIIEWEDYYRSSLNNRVEFYPQVVLNKEVAEFMNSSHLGLYPARAEGWNLSLLESMACGCNIVTTDYSAHTEYCNSNNASLVKPSSLESAFDSVFFDGQVGEWAHISDSDIDKMAEYVRSYYDEWKGGSFSLNTAGIDTANKFTWDNTIVKIETGLND